MKANVFFSSLFPDTVVYNPPPHQMVEFVGLSGKIEFDTQVHKLHLKLQHSTSSYSTISMMVMMVISI